MAWKVIARVDGIADMKYPRIVADTSLKGWPKVKDYAGAVVPDQWMAGKDVVHVIGESEDGKTISPALRQPAKSERPLVVPAEAQEIIARKAAPPVVEEITPHKVEPDGLPKEITEPIVSPVAVAKEAAPKKNEAKAKRPYTKKAKASA